MQPYLRGLGLENFRVFADYQWFDFAPITILTGPNSSGKSSVLKALLFLKDNYENQRFPESLTNLKAFTELIFDGGLHDLSSVNVVLSKNTDSKNIGFAFPYKISKINLPSILKINYIFKDKNCESVSIQIFIENTKLIFAYSRDNIFFDFDLFNNLVNQASIDHYAEIDLLNLNKTEYNTAERDNFNQIFKNKHWKYYKVSQIEIYEKFKDYFFYTEDIEYEDANGYPNFYESAPLQMSFEQYLNKQSFFSALFWLFVFNFGIKKIEDKEYLNVSGTPDEIDLGIEFIAKCIGIDSENYERKKHVLKGGLSLKSYSMIDYLPSVKGRSKRSYQGNDDHILNSLIKESLRKTILSSQNRMETPYSIFINKWAIEFKMNQISVHRDDLLDIGYITVDERSLSDVGFGLSQITALLLKFSPWTQATNRHKGKSNIFLIEEPESNLHPKFQSQLADLFLDAQKQFNHQFIIETHSEYMIRKFQYLVAKGEMKPEDIVIYYLHDPNDIPKGEKQVKKIEILKNGDLSDEFGDGFFDEISRWQFELLKIRNSQNN